MQIGTTKSWLALGVIAAVTLGCGDDAPAGGPNATGAGGEPWGGLTIDEPYSTAAIELVDTVTQQGFRAELYRNRAYTCGRAGYQTFVVVYAEGLPADELRPLWVRLHGGGVGAYAPDGTYVPAPQEGMLDEEGMELGQQLLETGLITKVRQHAAGFRFLMPSLCDHDVYSGVGVPEPNNPNSPDENGQTRAADGLLATEAAIAWTRAHYPSSHTFLHGTSAGSIGSFSLAYALERAGLRLSGIVADSHVLSLAFLDLIEDIGCSPYDGALVAEKVGPMTDPEHLPDQVVSRGDITVPIMHVWSHGDPSCCGDTPYTFTDDQGVERTLGACDYHHERLRAAIEAAPPGGSSVSLRLCVNDPATTTPGACNRHGPTMIAFDEPTPPGDQDDAGADYNQEIVDWVSGRLAEAPP